jgi:nicotinic acid mononucleotide adenylyltransferase
MGGVAVVYRSGQNQSLIQSIMKQNPSKLYFISSDDQSDDISSTLIRQKLQLNEDCEHLTYKSVLQFLQFNKINK